MGANCKGKTQRYELIDAIRGLAMVNMVLYHLCYDIFILYGKNPDWIRLPGSIVWERMICVTFIVLAGVSAGWSRNLLKRGLLLNGLGFAITLVTWIVTPDSLIFFGILNLLGCCLLLLIPLKRWIGPRNWPHFLAGSLAAFFFFYPMEKGYLGFGSLFQIAIPEKLFQIRLLIPFGIHGSGFLSSDYFPILPWFFLFLAGYAASFWFRREKKPGNIWFHSVPVLSWLGKYSLPVYLIHQPLLFGICMLLF